MRLGNLQFFAALLAGIVASVWLGAATPAAAQSVEAGAGAQSATPAPFNAAKWDRTLAAVGSYVAAGNAARAETELYSELLDDVIAEANAERHDALAKVDKIEPLLAALGPSPDTEKQETEADEVAAIRQRYQPQLEAARARIAAADIVLVRAERLKTAVVGLSRQQLASQLNQRTGTPLAVSAIEAGAKDVAAGLARIAAAPTDWRASLTDAQWRDFKTERLPLLLGVFAVALLLGLVMRRILNRRFGYDANVGHITQSRRLAGAVSRFAADGLIPASVFLILFVWSKRELAGIGSPLFADAIAGAAVGLAITYLAYAGLTAALAPDDPGWRLLPVRDRGAHAIRSRATIFAIVSSVDLFIWTALDSLAKSEEFLTVYALAACTARAAALLPLLRSRIWRVTPPAGATGDEADSAPTETPAQRHRSLFWLAVRLLFRVAAVSAVFAAGAGYADLALFISRALSGSMVTVGGVFLLRGAMREAIQAAMNAPKVRRWLGLSFDAADAVAFWTSFLLEPIFLTIAVILTAPLWGFSQREMLAWTGEVLSGFRVGEAIVSPAAIGVAVLAFVVVLLMTRTAQRALLNRVLPRTRMDAGAQNSLATAFGYMGVLLAAVIGVSTLGFDLSNLAIVAGALSVGIGFGLQSIVNNFVSGLILLAERPVKVGDWVIIGDRQGIVKRISIRATEIETFERSSVIIPNSELISNSVVNRTHKDRYGRVEVPVGVAYGSNTREAAAVLIEIALENEEVLQTPEPQVVFAGFGDSSLDLSLRVFTSNNFRSLAIATQLRHEIAARFAAKGIEIPFPQRVVHMADGAAAPTPNATLADEA